MMSLSVFSYLECKQSVCCQAVRDIRVFHFILSRASCMIRCIRSISFGSMWRKIWKNKFINANYLPNQRPDL